jgi:hypothetical protein
MRRRSTTAAALAVWLVVGWIAGWSHQASTRHVVCPEHGEQLETSKLAQLPIADGQDRVVATAVSHGHDDCAIAEAMTASGVVPATATLTTVLALVHFMPSRDVVFMAPRVSSSYRIAPKTSPPLAA